MKESTNVFSRLILIAIVCAGALSSSIRAQEVVTNAATANSGGTARLIVHRGANFGVLESVNLFVDGNRVAVLPYHGSYDAPLSAGKHVVSIDTIPKTYSEGKPKQLTIRAEPGKTYTFTAVWPDSERAGLVAD